jgi:pimeloyl-ACP methyl ester carboxylesterase
MQVETEQGTTVVVHDLGGDGSNLLIAHATGFCGRAYEPLARLLSTGHHVWAVDMRGHGDSPPPADGDFAWRGIMFDVLAATRAIGDEPLHVFGHSMGGAVALLAEAEHEGTFASAYVYEPIVVGPDLQGLRTQNPMANAARSRREVFPSKEAALWRYASRPPLDRLAAGSLAAYVTHGFEDLPDGTARLKCRAESEARTFEASGTITSATVASAALPVLVATGGSEPESPIAAQLPGLVDALPNARLVVYRHLGHFGPFQDIESIARDVFAHTGA